MISIHREEGSSSGFLSPYTVLDLTDEKGFFLGKILGDLGADVIKIERPEGDPSRRIGPFLGDEPSEEKSLLWFAFNANKRGITLNLRTGQGVDIFKNLVARAHVVIESGGPEYLDDLGLGYAVLSEINPRIIVTSISLFGQEGPYKDYKGNDLVAGALSGYWYLCGEPDRPPTRISHARLSYGFACEEAAIGTLCALYYQELTGEGQHVDVSIQESMLVNLHYAPHCWEMHDWNLKRQGGGITAPGSGEIIKLVWKCKDGYVLFMPLGSTTGTRYMIELSKWIESEGMGDESFGKIDWWSAFDVSQSTAEQQELKQRALGYFARFFETRTKQELYQGAVRRNIQLYPVNTIADLLENPQLENREFWGEVYYPELDGNIVHPGAFAKFTSAELKLVRRAPLIGEHNEEIYIERLNFTKDQLVALKESGVI